MNASQIVFEPALGWGWLCLLAAAGALAVLPAIIRRARGAAFRALGFLFLFGILSGPHEVVETKGTLPDIALMLVDHSQSMAIGKRAELAANAAAALRAVTKGTELRQVDVPASGDGGTALFAAIHDALEAIPKDQLAGIIAITDGEATDLPGIPSFDAPFSALLVAKGEETDRELRLLDAPAFGLTGQTASARFEVLDHGADDFGGTVPVSISEDGGTRRQNVPIGQPVAVTIPIRHAGPLTVAISAPPLPGEVSLINNQAAFTLNGIHKRLNVLLISGSPTQGERSWRLLLKSDPAIQLVHFTILRLPGETIDADPQDLALVPFPVQQLFETDIGKFDLIILDRFDAAGLLPAAYLADIAAYVERGGALFAETGPEFATPDSLAFTPLGAVLPARPASPGDLTEQFAPAITPQGARHPVTAPFAALALPPWFRMEAATPIAGDVLMTGAGNAPLLILGNAGHGRVGMLLSDQFWLWTRGGAHDGPALPLLRRIVHWLLREPALEAESLNLGVDGSKLTIMRQTMSPSDPDDATLTAPDGTKRTLHLVHTAPGRYEVSLDIGKGGVWKAAEGGLTAYIAADVTNRLEYQDLAATANILRPFARNIVWLGRGRPPPLSTLLQPRHAHVVTGTRDIPLLPPIGTVWFALALIGAAWWRESR